jgi:hypothetical protein
MVLLSALLTTQLAMGSLRTEPASDTIVPSEYVGKGKVDHLFKLMEQSKFVTISEPASPLRLNSSDIPYLLERANSKKMLETFPRNSISSYLQTRCSEGMVALWLVEGIRIGSYFPSLNPMCMNADLGFKSRDFEKESESLHPRVAAAYLKWWKRWHGNTVAGFQVNPLKGTGLAWH